MSVIAWLLDSDPSIRWQTLRDLMDAPDEVVADERARVETEGWGARLLSVRDQDGQWAGGACFPAHHDWSAKTEGQPWTSTLHTLELLRDFGLDPASEQAVETVALVRDNCRWEYDAQPFFSGEVERASTAGLSPWAPTSARTSVRWWTDCSESSSTTTAGTAGPSRRPAPRRASGPAAALRSTSSYVACSGA